MEAFVAKFLSYGSQITQRWCKQRLLHVSMILSCSDRHRVLLIHWAFNYDVSATEINTYSTETLRSPMIRAQSVSRNEN
jgi:hypothetical protein